MDEDAAAALGAVGDAQAVDARRVALEVARERIMGALSCSIRTVSWLSVEAVACRLGSVSADDTGSMGS